MTIKKVTIDKAHATTLLNPSPITLVTTRYEEKNNIMTISWGAPVSFSPAIVAIMVGRGNYSHSLIENSRQFAINIPNITLLDAVKICGTLSGNIRDKFIETGLTTLTPLVVDAPLINECFAHIECQLNQSIPMGDHTIFCGNVVSVFAQEGLFTSEGDWDIDVNRPIIHLAQNQYVTLNEMVK